MWPIVKCFEHNDLMGLGAKVPRVTCARQSDTSGRIGWMHGGTHPRCHASRVHSWHSAIASKSTLPTESLDRQPEAAKPSKLTTLSWAESMHALSASGLGKTRKRAELSCLERRRGGKMSGRNWRIVCISSCPHPYLKGRSAVKRPRFVLGRLSRRRWTVWPWRPLELRGDVHQE
jgi:hypothetical protein